MGSASSLSRSNVTYMPTNTYVPVSDSILSHKNARGRIDVLERRTSSYLTFPNFCHVKQSVAVCMSCFPTVTSLYRNGGSTKVDLMSAGPLHLATVAHQIQPVRSRNSNFLAQAQGMPHRLHDRHRQLLANASFCDTCSADMSSSRVHRSTPSTWLKQEGNYITVVGNRAWS